MAGYLYLVVTRSKSPSSEVIGLFTNKYSILAFVIGFCFLNAILLWQPLHSLFSVTTITMTQLFTIYGLALIPTALIQLGRMLRHR